MKMMIPMHHGGTLPVLLSLVLSVSALNGELVWQSSLDGDATAGVGLDGIATGTPAPFPDLNGNVGGAVDFSGGDFYYEIDADPEITSISAGSISAWIYWNNTSGEQGAVAVGASGGGATDYFTFMRRTATEIRVDLDDGDGDGTGGGRLSALATGLTDSTWYHVATTFTAEGTLRLYIDGVEVNTRVLQNATSYDNLTTWLIGTERTGSRFLDGALDDVRIYDHELTPAEVDTLFADGPLFGPLFSGTDTDGDGMPDEWETANGLTVGVNDASLDNDTNGGPDGLTNLQEWQSGTDPQDSDSDDDTLSDGAEVHTHGTSPKLADTDGDTIGDAEEVVEGVDGFVTDPVEPDTDGDNWRDDFEVANVAFGFDPTVNDGAEDPDGDDLENDLEFTLNTDPLDPDSDDDGLNDGAEDIAGTDPNNPDTDGDGLLDGVEDNNGTYVSPTETGSDPLFPDTDLDLIPDGVEVANVALGLDPNVDNYDDDTDGDTISNGNEIEVTLTDYLKADTDDDGLNDNVEDADMDGIVDVDETNANDPDTDDDGLLDGVEDEGGTYGGPGMTGSDPLLPDTDGDLIPDGVEVANIGLGLDPNIDNYDDDTDGDTISNGNEIEVTLTNMFSTDSDNDGLADNVEDVNMDGVVDANETSALNPDTDQDCLMDGVEDGGGVLVSPSMTGTNPLLPDGSGDLDADGFTFATEVLYGTDPLQIADSPAGMLPDILFVGGNATGDQGSDDEVQHFLACRYGVEAITYIQANVSTVADTVGRDLLVLSSTPGSGDIRNKFPNVAVPTINWEEAVSDNGGGEYGMSSEGMSKTVTMTAMTLASHLITEGMPTTIDMFAFNATNRETVGTGMLFPGLTSAANAVDGIATNGPRNGQPITGNAMVLVADTGDAVDPAAGVTGNIAPARRVMFPITDNTFASLSDDAKELFGRCTDWAMDLLAPSVAGVEVTGAFNGVNFEVAAANLDPATTYELRRSVDGRAFTTVAGSSFTGAATHVFVDTAPPAGTTMLYQIWTP